MGSGRKLKIGGNVSVKVSGEGRVVVFMLLMLMIHLFLVVNVKRGFRKQILIRLQDLSITPLISQP